MVRQSDTIGPSERDTFARRWPRFDLALTRADKRRIARGIGHGASFLIICLHRDPQYILLLRVEVARSYIIAKSRAAVVRNFMREFYSRYNFIRESKHLRRQI